MNKDILNYLTSEQFEKFRNEVHDELYNKLNTVLDVAKEEVASSIYGEKSE
jgi:hypothetical protein